jgi:hypothetical protein
MLVDGSIGAFNHQDGIAYLDAVRTPLATLMMTSLQLSPAGTGFVDTNSLFTGSSASATQRPSAPPRSIFAIHGLADVPASVVAG